MNPPAVVTLIIAIMGVTAVLWPLCRPATLDGVPGFLTIKNNQAKFSKFRLVVGLLVLFGIFSTASYTSYIAHNPTWLLSGYFSLALFLFTLLAVLPKGNFYKVALFALKLFVALTVLGLMFGNIWLLFGAAIDGKTIFKTHYSSHDFTVAYNDRPFFFWLSIISSAYLLSYTLKHVKSYVVWRISSNPSASVGRNNRRALRRM